IMGRSLLYFGLRASGGTGPGDRSHWDAFVQQRVAAGDGIAGVPVDQVLVAVRVRHRLHAVGSVVDDDIPTRPGFTDHPDGPVLAAEPATPGAAGQAAGGAVIEIKPVPFLLIGV